MSANIPSAVIFGCAGPELTSEESAFFQENNPFGFILFSRNIQEPKQVIRLVDALRKTTKSPTTPILIDQEGGEVQRLEAPHWPNFSPVRLFGDLFEIDPKAGLEACWLNYRIIANILYQMGITVNCAPVLDIPSASSHPIIGDRAFSCSAKIVTKLGGIACKALLDGGVTPVIKHIPGHGRARVDSHHELPVVETSLAKLSVTDFKPFHDLSSMPWAMTAHIVFADIDKFAPATSSSIVINDIVRGIIGFNGILISDDIGMNALRGNFCERAENCLSAGCDFVLHCSGDIEEMREVMLGVSTLTSSALDRVSKAIAICNPPKPFDTVTANKRLQELLKKAGY